ncbi:MAG: hypothetical protein IPJ19_14085 [Planctomycetes bacterium]|nr:hypothetical protein [Planctomycetota bacterium]
MLDLRRLVLGEDHVDTLAFLERQPRPLSPWRRSAYADAELPLARGARAAAPARRRDPDALPPSINNLGALFEAEGQGGRELSPTWATLMEMCRRVLGPGTSEHVHHDDQHRHSASSGLGRPAEALEPGSR